MRNPPRPPASPETQDLRRVTCVWSQFSDNRGVDSGPQPAGSGPRRRRCFRPRSRAGEHQVPAPGSEAGALVLVGGSALLLSWSLHWSGEAHRTGGRPASLGPLPPVPCSPGDASRQPWNRADHAGAPVAPLGGRVKLPIAARWRVPVRRPGRSSLTSGPPPCMTTCLGGARSVFPADPW